VSGRVLRFPDGGWVELVANDPALDLVNTVSWRLDPARRADRLSEPQDLLRWLRFAGIVGNGAADGLRQQLAADPPAGQTALERSRQLRERLYAVVLPLALGHGAMDRDVARLRSELLRALGRTEIVSLMPLVWRPGSVTLDSLPDLLGVHAIELLQRQDPGRLRQCRGDGCGWLFLDRSRNGSRLWCSSADCGNRARARRHYQRHGAGGSGGGDA
jgi:predicted RNA-binding Zn ribbon-like protein